MDNLSLFAQELLNTKREGIDDFIAYLRGETDIERAPASTKYHLCIEGGLLQHSLNVLKFAREVNKTLELNLEDKNLTIAALLHDMCKVNFYERGEEWDKEWKDKFNEWRKRPVWKIKDQLPLGHGEKSVIVVGKWIDLSTDEMLAIRWHMLKWDVSDSGKVTMFEAMEKYPLVKTIAIADQMAELYEVTRP